MRLIPITVLLAALLAAVEGTTAAQPEKDGRYRVELPLKAGRTRDPVLGGPRDKVTVSAWIPDGVKAVRGGVCNPFSKDEGVSKHWKAACQLWQFAYVQVDFDAVKKDEFTLLKTGLAELAKKSGHPELEHLPLCFTGMSRGGGMSMQLAELMPERTVATAPVCLEVGPGSEATRKIPVMTVFGEKDGQQMKLLLAKLPAERKQDARFGIAVQWNRRHEFALANNLAFVFFEDVIARRLPKQPPADKPTPLSDIPLEDGWLGDTATWGKDGRRPTIAAWKEYTGDRTQACWFPSHRVAAVWQAFVGGTKDVTVAEPPGLGDGQPFVSLSAGKPVAVKITLGDTLKPRKVELWDGDRRLAERSEAPWAFAVPLRPGIHSLYATAEGPNQVVRTSRPHTVVVTE